MPKGSEEHTLARRNEIIDACSTLYETLSFDEISLKDISKVTSLSRPSIYNYFQTKEEIFLALFQREYELWNEALRNIIDTHDQMTREELADSIARSLDARPKLVKLLAMNMFDMELKSRFEFLVEFKTSFIKPIRSVTEMLNKYYPGLSAEENDSFRFAFFPFIFGVYPYSNLMENQIRALQMAGLSYQPRTIYDLVYRYLLKILP